MRINSINTVNYNSTIQKIQPKAITKPVVDNGAEQVNFKGYKGIKGATIGAAIGTAFLGVMSVVAAPFITPTTSFILLFSGTGALAGYMADCDDDDELNRNK